jgi:hypothetical protein
MEVLPVKSEYPYSATPGANDNELSPPTSRFTDEKISDESGIEASADSVHKPAGLNNPFWN